MSAVLDLRSPPVAGGAVRTAAAPLLAPALASAFARDVLDGLSGPRRQVPAVWLHDTRGAALFERICALDSWTAARAEAAILASCAPQIAAAAGPGAALIELGSGAGRLAPLLLQALRRPAACVPVHICAPLLADAAAALRARTALPVLPMAADYTRLESLPLEVSGRLGRARRIVFLPGAAIGGFDTDAAVALMARIGALAGREGLFVVGVDSTPDPAQLQRAHDDALGVHAAFHHNLLLRINRELDADFSPDAFRHEVRRHPAGCGVETHLVSVYTQRVHVLGRPFHFRMGESIQTQQACAHGLARFQHLARRAGWLPLQMWMDGRARHALHVFERAAAM